MNLSTLSEMESNKHSIIPQGAVVAPGVHCQEDDLARQFISHIKSGLFSDVLLSLSDEGIVQQVSNACESMFGYTPPKMVGRNILEFLFEEDVATVKAHLATLRTNHAASNFIYRSQNRTGVLRHISWSVFWSENEGQIFAICRDVTELREAQKKQLATEQLLQALIENSFDMLALVDEKGNYVYVSESFYNTFEYNQRVLQGYTASELVGTNCFTYMHPDELPRLLDQYNALLQGEKKFHVPPFRFRNASGVYRWTEVIVTNQLDNPDIKAIVVSARDVHHQVETESKLKEMQLLQALSEGEEKERSRIARDLHDEISGMIAAAKMHFSALLEKAPEVAATKEFASVMDLLQKAAVQVRRTSHNLMPEIVLQAGLDEALKRYCNSISSEQLTVDYFSFGTISRSSPNFELSLYRIAQELMNNLLKHSDASHAIVQLSEQNRVLALTIEDNGKGFQPSHQADGTGMNSVRKRVEAMNGQLEVNSEPGRGTSVYLEFEK